MKFQVYIFRHASFQNSILDFCEVYDYDEFWKFPKESGCTKQLEVIYEAAEKDDPRSSGSFDIINHEEIKLILLQNNILSLVEKFRNQINLKIAKWELDVKKTKSNIDDLLNG